MAPDSDADQLPLRGVVLCCTSVAQDVRTRLASVAAEMGALHKLDLTADVTHLIVGSINTPKYHYVAKERPDIIVLSAEFVERAREIWTDGGEVDLQELEREFRLPIFFGLEICLTGVTDLEERKGMEMTVTKEGARYSADLHKQVTHLIAAKAEGAKYTHGKQWGIKVVGLKWFEDSLLRGMTLDESLYLPELPREQQGIGAFRTRVRQPKRTSVKRGREEAGSEQDGGRKKLRKSASMRLGGQSQHLWQSISQHEFQVDTTEMSAWDDSNAESQTLRDSIGPNSKRRSNAAETIERSEVDTAQGLFAGHYVLIHGFEEERKIRLLRNVIENNGAVVVNSPAELEAASQQQHFRERCLLMPHDNPGTLPRVPEGTLLVTEWWVERCVHFKQYMEPKRDTLSQPLHDSLIPAFRDLRISATGFGGVDRRMSAKLVQMMGATFQEDLLPSTDVLLCATEPVGAEKAAYASKHDIPVVPLNWLWESLKSKSLMPYDRYRLKLPPYDPSVFTGGSAASSPAPNTAGTNPKSREGHSRGDELGHPKRLSNTRKRHATPVLPLQRSRVAGIQALPMPTIRSAPLFHEDDSEDEVAPTPQLDEQPTPQMSAPTRVLREISSNNSSQGRTAHASPEKEKEKGLPSKTPEAEAEPVTKAPISPPKSPPKSHSPPKPNAAEQQLLNSDLLDMAKRFAASGQEAVPKKRKSRPLGRNASGTSLLLNRPESASTSSDPNEEDANEADGFAPSKVAEALPPSTQLGYGEPEAEAHRQRMSKKIGTKGWDEESGAGKRVASVGTVKDSEDVMSARGAAMGAAAAAGGRSKARLGRTRT